MFNKICKGIAVVLFLITFNIIWNKTNEYTMDGEVIMVSQGHWVMIRTEDGNRWEIDDYSFCEGDRVKVTLNNQDTPETKKDDTIVKVVVY